MSQGLYDRRTLDRVSTFLSELVSCLLSTDPQRRPSAEEVLRRIQDERQKVGGRSNPQTLTREEEEDEDGDEDDSDYETLVRSNASKSKFNFFSISNFLDIFNFIMVLSYFRSDFQIRSPEEDGSRQNPGFLDRKFAQAECIKE